MVSPANTYGNLDGGFDDAISRVFSPKDDYTALTRHVQAQLYESHRSFLPPGSCELARIPEELRGRLRYGDGNGWGARWLGLCPTMRLPGSCEWGREVVHECIWSLLCKVSRHNREVERFGEGSGGKPMEEGGRIESILMTPLSTETGLVSERRWAEQTVLAVKHFIEASQNEEAWKRMGLEGG